MVERKHQHLLNVARSWYFQSQIPIAYWSECVMTAVYLINRTPTPLLAQKCPYEILFHKPVDYEFLRVFGCLAFASTLQAHRTKVPTTCTEMCVHWLYPRG